MSLSASSQVSRHAGFMDDNEREYRQDLVVEDKETQRIFDRMLATLAVAGLGISFGLVDQPGLSEEGVGAYLLFARVSWAATLIVVLISHLLSQKALRKAVRQVDEGKIRKETPGGRFAIATDISNYLAGSLFVAGVILFAVFIFQN